MYVYIFAFIIEYLFYIFIHVCFYVYMFIFVFACTCLFTYIIICAHVYINICMYIHICISCVYVSIQYCHVYIFTLCLSSLDVHTYDSFPPMFIHTIIFPFMFIHFPSMFIHTTFPSVFIISSLYVYTYDQIYIYLSLGPRLRRALSGVGCVLYTHPTCKYAKIHTISHAKIHTITDIHTSYF